MQLTFQDLRTPWSGTTKDFNYYHVGLSNIHKLEGYYSRNFDIYDSIIDQKFTIVKTAIIEPKLDICGSVISDNQKDEKEHNRDIDIFITAPFLQIRELRKKSPRFKYGLQSTERWFKEESLINFKQRAMYYGMPDNLRNNINQYLRSGNDDLKTIVCFINTMDRFYSKRKYYDGLNKQINNIKRPRNF